MEDRHGLMDFELGDGEKTACFHCAKIIEMFLIRHKTITFLHSQVKSKLDTLKMTKMSQWEQSSADYFI